MIGPTEIRYSSTGEPSYSGASYVLNGVTPLGTTTTNLVSIFVPIVGDESEKDVITFVPTISNGRLKPLTCFIDDAPQFGV
jgi:hypothetical protein